MNKDLLKHPVIIKLALSGWRFRVHEWGTATNDGFVDLRFQSPNMLVEGSLDEDAASRMTEEYMLEREAKHVAIQWASDVFSYNMLMTNPVADELAKHFRKENSVKFKPLYASATTFDVIVNPAIKNQPKNVKVTIEIT